MQNLLCLFMHWVQQIGIKTYTSHEQRGEGIGMGTLEQMKGKIIIRFGDKQRAGMVNSLEKG